MTKGTQIFMMSRMKPINWNSDKNMTLKAERGVSFEEVLVAISQGLLLNVVEHPNKAKVPEPATFCRSDSRVRLPGAIC